MVSTSLSPGAPSTRSDGKPTTPRPPQGWRRWIWPAGLALTVLLWTIKAPGAPAAQTFTYTAFVNEVTTNKVATADITNTGAVSGTLTGGAHYVSTIPTALNDNSLSSLLLAHKVQITGTLASATSVLGTLLSLLPLLFLLGLFLWIRRSSSKQPGTGGALSGIMGIGKSKAKLYDEDKPTTRFTDIAGYDAAKAEVMEVVDFLKRPAVQQKPSILNPHK